MSNSLEKVGSASWLAPVDLLGPAHELLLGAFPILSIRLIMVERSIVGEGPE